MANEPAKQTPAPGTNPSGRRRRTWRLALIAAGIALAVGALGFGAWKGYRHFRSHQRLAEARGFMEKRDYANANLVLQYLLYKQPDDLEANRLMAKLMETAGSKAEIQWRQQVVRLEPGVVENHLALASAALRLGDRAIAGQALAGVPDAGKETAAYHKLATWFRAQTGQPALALAHLSEAARLDPENEVYQFGFALDALSSMSSAARAMARWRVEQIAANPRFHSAACRALIGDALKRGDREEALRFAEQLGRAPTAAFQDQVAQLDVLRQLQRMEFWWCLAQLEKQAESEWSQPQSEGQATGGLGKTVALLSWLNRMGLASATVEWTRRMPAELRLQAPVRTALVEAHAALDDWKTVKSLTEMGKWAAFDWKRKVLYARALRAEGEENGWSAQWSAAVSASRESPAQLMELARLASAWKWDDQIIEVLWILAADRAHQTSALNALNKKYIAAGRTRDLLRVAQFGLEATPERPGPKNNVAYFSMLLGSNLPKAYALAAEVYQQEPANPSVASTYAYALHRQKKTKEGLKILRQLSEQQRKDPSVALCYGILLAADGSKDEARQYLDLAAKGSLLPEEKALIAKVK